MRELDVPSVYRELSRSYLKSKSLTIKLSYDCQAHNTLTQILILNNFVSVSSTDENDQLKQWVFHFSRWLMSYVS